MWHHLKQKLSLKVILNRTNPVWLQVSKLLLYLIYSSFTLPYFIWARVLLGESIYWCVSQDISDELQSPPVMCVNGPEDKLFRSQSADITLSSEKERIKKMLSEG